MKSQPRTGISPGRRLRATAASKAREGQHACDIGIARCLRGDHLRWVTQPIEHAHTREVLGHECLLRSSDPDFPTTAAVLEAVGRTRNEHELGGLVARRAASIIASLPEKQLVFLNMSPCQLEKPDALLRSLAPLVMHARRCVIELTEERALLDVRGWRQMVEDLRCLGFRIALDDLGAGHSRVGLLACLTPEFIKIDRGLIQALPHSRKRQRELTTIVGLAGCIGAEVIAEGIETDAQVRAAIGCGAHFLQGFGIARPNEEPAQLVAA